MLFIELLGDAARYLEWLERADDFDFLDEDGKEGGDKGKSRRERRRNLAYAAGFAVRTKAEDWKLFCERMSVPHLVLWKVFPGFDRVQRALSMAEVAAFDGLVNLARIIHGQAVRRSCAAAELLAEWWVKPIPIHPRASRRHDRV